jgi:GntR family transcriptional regulator
MIAIDLQSAKPVFQQIIDQVKLDVASARLRPGDKMPTVRELAVQLRINRNTVSRAYNELEREGLLHTRPGQGSFISDNISPLRRNEMNSRLAAAAAELIAQARLFGFSQQEIETLISQQIDQIYNPPAAAKPARSTPGGRK